ncbi:hypothetical protein AB3S75_005283 [Citrus x aurantiifolia]
MSASSAVAATRTDDVDEVDKLSDSPNDVSEDRNDVSEKAESEEHKSHVESGSSSREKSKVRLPSDTIAIEESRDNFDCSNGPFSRQKVVSSKNHEESKYLKSGKHLTPAEDNGSQEYEISKKYVGAFLPVKARKEQNELHTDGEVHLLNSQIMESETTSPSSLTRKSMAGGVRIRDCLGEGTSVEESKPMDVHSADDKQRMESRFASPAVRIRSLSPGAEIKDGNKRPAVICDFFTKGWCIKGNSCRFLHVKDDVNNTTQLLGEDVATASAKASLKTDAQFDEGSRNMTKRSRMPSFPDALACSGGNDDLFSSDLSSERILTQERGESKRLPQFQENHRLSLLQKENTSSDNSPSSREDIGCSLSSKDAKRESFRHNWPADYGNCASLINEGSSPIFRNNMYLEYRSSSIGSAVLSSNYHSGNPSTYPISLEERPWIQSKYMHNDYSSPAFSHAMNSSLGTCGPTSSGFPSHHISTWTGLSLPFSSASLSASPLDAKKLLDSNKECRNSRLALFLRSTSPFSVSEPEKPQISSDYKTKISSNDWEPSVPFQPSFVIIDTSSPGRDSALNTSDQKLCGDSMLSNTVVPGCNGDKSSVSSHGRFSENVVDKNCCTARNDSLADSKEGVGTSIVDEQNGAMPKENDPSVSTCFKDISKSKKPNAKYDSRIQNDRCRRNKEPKVDWARQNSEMDLEHKADGDGRKESKLMKHFRNDLVELVKELLKPSWREGRLSKDAHNTIVKKAVDKVLATLHPHQIPTTMESTKQYLSSSQPKIAKLVEGYVDKYGKS